MARRRTRPLIDRFWEKVDQSAGPDACWPWMSGRNPEGYGNFTIDNRTQRATRLAVQFDGRNIDGLVVMHTCDNPPCVNPAHLVVGTTSDNITDMWRKGRGGYPRTPEVRQRVSEAIKATFAAHPEKVWERYLTHCRHGHPFDEENTAYKADGSRRCRTCVKRDSRALTERRQAMRRTI